MPKVYHGRPMASICRRGYFGREALGLFCQQPTVYPELDFLAARGEPLPTPGLPVGDPGLFKENPIQGSLRKLPLAIALKKTGERLWNAGVFRAPK
jgi:hypothetical protein